ncbi:penicillin acylase family protein [Halobacteriovorax sp. CON-3]|uniref:penicillin acylase family protein n=1 Tax=Halobacteriovorax sp. CON-3 TaxID=3157710 RepID=UPI0037133388
MEKPNLDYTSDVLDNVTRHISCENVKSFLFAQGYYHGKDRLMQMEMLRLIAQGRLCECIKDSEETFAIDKYMRELGINHFAKEEIQNIDEETNTLLTHYVDGINKAIGEGHPFEFKILGHRPSEWRISDTILTIKAMSFLGLAQGQQDLEKLIIQLLQNAQKLNDKVDQDTQVERIKSLAKGALDTITDSEINLISKVKVYNPLIPESYKFLKNIPKIQASNNWVSNMKGEAIHACDPHLECNRLPAIWYEMKANIKNVGNFFGISMPGVPGFVMGRSDDTAFSFTYGFMDMVDHFIEEVRDNKYRFESNLFDFKVRRDLIKRKKKEDVELYIRETHAGFLEVDSENKNIVDGHYLSMAWSCRKRGGAKTLKAIMDLLYAKNVDDLFGCVSNVAISCNWLLSDSSGNIAYHQSGVLPKRAHSGLYPVEGFFKQNIWQGYYEGHQLYHFKNPDIKIIATANNRIQNEQFPTAINAPMASYRKDRIEELLIGNKDHSVEMFKTMQSDTFSRQADLYINVFHSVFEKNEIGKRLLAWKRNYDVDNCDATIFENFYRTLLKDFFSDHLLGEQVTTYCMDETSIIADFYGLFDRIFLTSDIDHIWFKDSKEKEQYIEAALNKCLADAPKNMRWGDKNRYKMKHILFDGKLPLFLGFDIDNVEIPGNRSTITQGAVYEAHGRTTSFVPSWKMVTNHSSPDVYTVLPGGLSDRRFSKNYKSDVSNWINNRYRHNVITNGK